MRRNTAEGDELSVHEKNVVRSEFTKRFYFKRSTALVEQNYTNALMAKFHKDVTSTPSFSRAELLAFVKKSFHAIPIYKKTTTPISLKNLKREVENIFLTAAHPLADNKKSVINYFEALPGSENTYRLQVKYQSSVLPMLVKIIASEESEKIDDDSLIYLELSGLPFPDKKDCLTTIFTRAFDTLKIDWIRPRESVCPIPLKQQGNFLLEFAEAIARALKVNKMELTDASEIHCLENDEDIDLWLLKLFQQGKTWYESKGFAVEANKERYQEKRNHLLNFKIADLESNLAFAEKQINRTEDMGYLDHCSKLNNLDSRTRHLCDFLKMKPMVEQYLQTYKQQTNGKLLSGFMAWVYPQSCARYKDFITFLFPSYYDLPYKVPVMDWIQANVPLGRKYYKHLKD